MSKIAEEILRDLIDKHLEFKSGLETTSIQYYAEYGKVSGSMYLNVKRLCEEYASQQLAEKDKEIERLKDEKNEALRLLNDAIKLFHSLPDLLSNSLGDCSEGNDYEIISINGERWINHKGVGSGEPLKQWIKSEIDKSLNK